MSPGEHKPVPADVLERLSEAARRGERESILEHLRSRAEHASEAARLCMVPEEAHRLRELSNLRLEIADEIEQLP